MPRQPLNIIILGGSFAGLSVAHNFLDKVIHQLSTFEAGPMYRVILISPSTHLYWNICAPRALITPKWISLDDVFIPIEPGFARHPFNEFTFMQGRCIAVDTSARTVTIELVRNAPKRHSANSNFSTSTSGTNPSNPRDIDYRSTGADRHNKVQTLPYHALIIATGSSAHSPLYSLHGTHEETLAELRDFHRRLEKADSVLIVGGGPSGVETAGQLAVYFNRGRKWGDVRLNREKNNQAGETIPRRWKRHLQSLLAKKHDSNAVEESNTLQTDAPTIEVTPPAPVPRKPKTITLLSGGHGLLGRLPPKVGKRAEKQLKNLGVHIVHNIRQLTATINSDGSSNCILNTDMTITSDLLISATGVSPNTSFLPSHILDENGYVMADRETLRVWGRGIGDRVYAIGDCGAYSKNYVLDVYEPIPTLMQNLHNDLLAHEYFLQTLAYLPTTPSLEPDTLPSSASSPEDHNRDLYHSKASSSGASPPSPIIPAPLTIRPRISFPAPISPNPPPSPNKAYTTLGIAPKPSPPTRYTPPTTSSKPRTPLLSPDEAQRKIAALQDAHYRQNPTETQIMPITRFGGVGVVFGWRVPSLAVWAFKGRDYKVKRARACVGKGGNPYEYRPGR